MLNPYREFEYWLKDVVSIGIGVVLDVATVVGAAGAVVGVSVAEDAFLSEAVVGWIHPATKSDTTIHVRSSTDKRHDG
jgi:hypothetical protein